MKKKILIGLLVVLLIASLVAVVYADNGDTIVYITNTGSKYHLAGCKYLSNSSHALTLEAAVQLGKTPCSVCKPPQLDKAPSVGSYVTTRESTPAAEEDSGNGLVSIATIAIPAALIGYGVAKRKKEE